MSEAAKKAALRIHYDVLEYEDLSDEGKNEIDDDAGKIDAAVAPMVAALERFVGNSSVQVNQPDECEGAEKALEPWRQK